MSVGVKTSTTIGRPAYYWSPGLFLTEGGTGEQSVIVLRNDVACLSSFKATAEASIRFGEALSRSRKKKRHPKSGKINDSVVNTIAAKR